MKQRLRQKQGIALVLTLAMLVLVTLLILGLSSIMTTERASARSNWDKQKAKAFAEMARDNAIAVLRDGIEAGRADGKFWAAQPGRITVFNSNGTVDMTSSRDLSSGTDNTQPEVDLNQATFGGSNPIASAASVGAASAPSMPVNWVNVLENPNSAAGMNNPVMGRYAFWVDDESSKINVNTADGTSKYISPPYFSNASSAPVSFGNGMPTEVSLQGLTGIPAVTAEAISSLTGVRPSSAMTHFFGDAKDILQAKDINGNQPDYIDNNFSLTHYSRSPELNIFGEPKIYLMTTTPYDPNVSAVNNAMIGPFGSFDLQDLTSVPYPPGATLSQIYPNSNPYQVSNAGGYAYPYGNTTNVGNQLPPFVFKSSLSALGTTIDPNASLPQCFVFDRWWDQGMDWADYNMGLRIAQYLKGYNSRGQPIVWPTFPGTTPGSGFSAIKNLGTGTQTGKYTDRQIDSIALQILNLLKQETVADTGPGFSLPYLMLHGFLSGKLVRGVSRAPHINQVVIKASTLVASPPQIQLVIYIQWYLPREYTGPDLSNHFLTDYTYGWNWNIPLFLNGNDCPSIGFTDSPTNSIIGATDPAPIPNNQNTPTSINYWGNQLLRVTDQNGNTAGADLFGNDPDLPDKDQHSAGLYHPSTLYPIPPTDPTYNPAYVGKYMGAGLNPGWNSCVFYVNSPLSTVPWKKSWTVGDYHCSVAGGAAKLREGPAITSITLDGGLAIWEHGDWNSCPIDPIPLDGWRGPNSTGESMSDPSVLASVMQGVIPIPYDGTPGKTSGVTLAISPTQGEIKTIVIRARDPLVNNFPGDWVGTVYEGDIAPGDDKYELDPSGNSLDSAYYPSIDPQGGACDAFNSVGGGDPSSYWMPPVNQNVPKSQRFPSVGYLQYIRTGLFPDVNNDPDYNPGVTISQEKGTPFRLFNMAPSTDPSQRTDGGASYPDWALLDLFTVPAAPQPLGSPLPPYLQMTFGGSTPGRINLNTAVEPFASSISRTVPLQAVFKNVQVSNTYLKDTSMPHMPDTPVQTPVDEAALVTAINDYVAHLKDSTGNSRPLMMPAEMANIPAVANYLYRPSVPSDQPYESRNDLVRQTVGNLTTQSNTFSIWAVGQAIKKRPGNPTPNYGTVDPGDLITSESRTHYIVERYIDDGNDNFPGNAKNPGADGIAGTQDDVVEGDDTVTPPIAGAHPKMTYPLPYKYRVVFAEEIKP